MTPYTTLKRHILLRDVNGDTVQTIKENLQNETDSRIKQFVPFLTMQNWHTCNEATWYRHLQFLFEYEQILNTSTLGQVYIKAFISRIPQQKKKLQKYVAPAEKKVRQEVCYM